MCTLDRAAPMSSSIGGKKLCPPTCTSVVDATLSSKASARSPSRTGSRSSRSAWSRIRSIVVERRPPRQCCVLAHERGARTPVDRAPRRDDQRVARPSDAPAQEPRTGRLALLLAAAMFVLVVDTSLMNVSISSVVEDLDAKVSGVQGAIALEALVSAAFILIGSKIGDLFGRKRAYVLGLLGYAVGAVAMTLAQSLTAVIVFWAI